MGRSPCQVVVRTRPTASFAQDQILIDEEGNAITLHCQKKEVGDDGPSNKQDSWRFRYHRVLHNVSQSTVYDAAARDIVQGAVEGVNGTLLSYGQTGAGKTFTMVGDTRNYEHRGIAPRALAHVFEEINRKIELVVEVKVSYMELYNEKIFDLLAPENQSGKSEDIVIICDDPKSECGVYVRGLTEVYVNSEKEALDQLFLGELRRTTAEHKLNRRSNRSHSIFTVHISQRSRLSSTEKVVRSKLCLVDLAGSERLKKTMMEQQPLAQSAAQSANLNAQNGSSMRKSGKGSKDGDFEVIKRESMHINRSLTYLEQCIVALSKKSSHTTGGYPKYDFETNNDYGGHSSHIPYRQTKLTTVLKDSLGGNCNTLMIACIWGENKHLEETISTLKLAQRMMKVQNNTAINVQMNPKLLLKKYEKEIKELKQELMMHDALAERAGTSYEELDEKEREEIKQQMIRYVKADPDDEDALIEIRSIRHVKEMLRQLKHMVLSQGEQHRRAKVHSLSHSPSKGETRSNGGSKESNQIYSTGQSLSAEENKDVDSPFCVGEEEGNGFGLGRVPDSSAPVRQEGIRRKESPSINKSPKTKSRGREWHFSSDAEAYQYFIAHEGLEISEALISVKAEQKERKANLKACINTVNELKREIDQVTADLNNRSPHISSKNDGLQSEDDVVDEEEFRLLKLKKMSKKQYKIHFARAQQLRKEVEAKTETIDAMKDKLLARFQEWHENVKRNKPRSLSAKFDSRQTVEEDLESLDEEDGAEMAYESRSSPEVVAAYAYDDEIEEEEEHEDDEDALDEGEKFEKMEMERVLAHNPDSVAFFQAQKGARKVYQASGSDIRKAQRAKRRI